MLQSISRRGQTNTNGRFLFNIWWWWMDQSCRLVFDGWISCGSQFLEAEDFLCVCVCVCVCLLYFFFLMAGSKTTILERWNLQKEGRQRNTTGNFCPRGIRNATSFFKNLVDMQIVSGGSIRFLCVCLCWQSSSPCQLFLILNVCPSKLIRSQR